MRPFLLPAKKSRVVFEKFPLTEGTGEDMANEDIYKLLEVDPKARIEVIEAAFRVMSKASHPDKPTNKGDLQLQQRLNDGMRTLRDPKEKSKLDRDIESSPAEP